MHFGMYILDCHVASLLAITDGDFVFCNDDVRKIAASSAAMTGGGDVAMTGEICVAMRRTHPRAYQVLLCKTCGAVPAKTCYVSGCLKCE